MAKYTIYSVYKEDTSRWKLENLFLNSIQAFLKRNLMVSRHIQLGITTTKCSLIASINFQ